jgi:oxysterol-binding protein-related protein 9/10/11
VDGVIHTFDPESSVHLAWTKVKHVPAERVIARLSGSWRSEIRYKREEDEVRILCPLFI